jgi:hypothetical protein
MVRFEQPWLLAAGVAAALPVWLARRGRRWGRRIGYVAVGLQAAAILLAAGALANPTAPIGQRADKPYLVLRDVSGSTAPQWERPLRWPTDLPRETFGFAASVAAAGQTLPANRTNAAPALRLALSRAAQIAGAVIWTDGQFQDADGPTAAAALAAGRVNVFILPMDSPPADARIADFTARRRLDGGVDLRVTIISNAYLSRTLKVVREGGAILEDRPLKLPAEEPATLRLTDNPPADRVAVYRAELSPADAFGQNDTATALALPPEQRVGLVSAPGALDAASLPPALRAQAEPLEPARAPRTTSGWFNYAAVLLADGPGTSLDVRSRAALEQYVRGGGGLVLIGSGPHEQVADQDDPLNRAAALVANPFQRRPMDVTVALDASGSMAEEARHAPDSPRQIKFTLAAEAVLSLKRHLTDRDRLRVIVFSDTARAVYDSGGARIDFARLRDALAEVNPAGPTDIFKALELATRQPPAADRLGLVILASDLEQTTGPFDPAAAAKLFEGKALSLAMVATVPAATTRTRRDDTAPLLRLKDLLQARLVWQDHLAGLADVFAGFVQRARGDAVRRGSFKLDGPETVLGLPLGGAPALDAYVLSAPQPEAEVMARAGADAVVARRRVGLGRSVAVALWPDPADNQALRGSPWFGQFVTAAVQWTLAGRADPRFAGEVARAGEKVHVVLTAQDAGGPMNLLNLTLHAASQSPDRPDSETALIQTAPGRYEADLECGAAPLTLAVRLRGAGVVWREPMGQAAPGEYAALGADWDTLRRLAELTGGRIVSPSELTRLARQWSAGRSTALWPVLLAAALAVMLLEWSLTRLETTAGSNPPTG